MGVILARGAPPDVVGFFGVFFSIPIFCILISALL